MKEELKNYGYVFLAAALWGSIGLFVKLMAGFGSTSAYTGFFRLAAGCLLLVILTLFIDGPKAFLVSRKTLLSCFLMGIVCQGLYNICYSQSVTENGMSVASVLLYTSPVFTGLLSMLLFKERLNGKKWLALAVNISGCALTATGGDLSLENLKLYGLLIGLGAGFTYACAAVFGRLATDDHASPFAIAAYNFFFGSLFIGLTLHPWTGIANAFYPPLLLTGFLFALIPTALGYVFYFKGLSGITQTSRVPVVCSVELVVASVIGILIFGEALKTANICGILLVLVSILLFS